MDHVFDFKQGMDRLRDRHYKIDIFPADHHSPPGWTGAGSHCKCHPSCSSYTRKEQLGSEDFPIRCLHFEVDMLGAPRIKSRDNSRQLEATVFVTVLMSAQGVAAVVIISVGVRLPEIQPGIGYGLTIGIVYIASDHQFGASHAILI